MRKIPILRKRKRGPSNGNTSKIKRLGPAIIESVRLGLPISKAVYNLNICYESYRQWDIRYKELMRLKESMNELAFTKFLDLNATVLDRDLLWFFDKIFIAELDFIKVNLSRISSVAKGDKEIVEEKIVYGTKEKNGKRSKFLKEKTIVKKKTPEKWTAAAWLLERRFPDDFGRNRVPEDSTASDVADEIDSLVDNVD